MSLFLIFIIVMLKIQCPFGNSAWLQGGLMLKGEIILSLGLYKESGGRNEKWEARNVKVW